MIRDNKDKPLIFLFMHIGKLLNERLRGSLREGGIHFGQARILVALLQHDKLIQAAIGHGLDIRPATVTNLVKKMEASGLINRKQDANDYRVMNITLTQKGRAAAKFAVGEMAQIEDEIRSELTQKELDALRKPLVSARNILGGSDPDI